MIQAAKDLAPTTWITTACQILDLPRSSFYRAQEPVIPAVFKPVRERPPSPRALTLVEKETVREVLNRVRFQDQAPREVYATLLDEERYLCLWRTIYRILAAKTKFMSAATNSNIRSMPNPNYWLLA